MIIVKKDGKNITVNGIQAQEILDAYKDPKGQNNVIDVEGHIFRVRDIKEIVETAKIDDENFRKRLEDMKLLNKKRQIKEWAELEQEQYQLLIDKQNCVSPEDKKDIQNKLVANDAKMKQIIKDYK